VPWKARVISWEDQTKRERDPSRAKWQTKLYRGFERPARRGKKATRRQMQPFFPMNEAVAEGVASRNVTRTEEVEKLKYYREKLCE
jgi:hypothetical protein